MGERMCTSSSLRRVRGGRKHEKKHILKKNTANRRPGGSEENGVGDPVQCFHISPRVQRLDAKNGDHQGEGETEHPVRKRTRISPLASTSRSWRARGLCNPRYGGDALRIRQYFEFCASVGCVLFDPRSVSSASAEVSASVARVSHLPIDWLMNCQETSSSAQRLGRVLNVARQKTKTLYVAQALSVNDIGNRRTSRRIGMTATFAMVDSVLKRKSRAMKNPGD